jgi:hypothetical protein
LLMISTDSGWVASYVFSVFFFMFLGGGFNHLEKYPSQWEGLFHLLSEKNLKPPTSITLTIKILQNSEYSHRLVGLHVAQPNSKFVPHDSAHRVHVGWRFVWWAVNIRPLHPAEPRHRYVQLRCHQRTSRAGPLSSAYFLPLRESLSRMAWSSTRWLIGPLARPHSTGG